MAQDSRPVVYVLGGFGLAILSVAVGAVLVALIDPMHYPDISIACRALAETGPECAAGASRAGIVSLLGLAVATVLAWNLRPRGTGGGYAGVRHELALPLALGSAAALAIAALIGAVTSVPSLSRVAQITQHADVISIANLGFPLLLQLAARAPNLRVRMGYLAAVAALLCITPFRASFLAVLLFGIVLPAAEAFFRGGAARARQGLRSGTTNWVLITSGVLLAVIFVGGMILYETAQRSAPLLASAPGGRQSGESIVPKLVQRIAYPLYQAHFAKVIAETEALPSAFEEVAAKLRLLRHANLNETLYRKIYGATSDGETTSLYYGEAAARSALAPVAWVVAGPLLYVLAWLALGRVKLDVGVLAGLAIWRGSLSGVFSVLPAFAIQSVVLLVLACAWGRGGGAARARSAPGGT